ncbi:MAG TPA: Cu(I)-responsive transcriptional regulator [Acidiphilium sp.]|uniref:Cu(I)-responsive transcriptional regulator n=1 Tax=unclassified Acidiphilium TaxID=2617493 RepID=UPI000BD08C5D|nr:MULTISPECIES: Cu(I)-responsive transcriptional regulator [unclassified Acidiphilium]OYV55730.1 MAG: Cu(I)-responsive transcriptional regulator [Acidiphilium sp. 20-67-58]OYV84736.1 MAG: Cu(I)-responsive transcriptional regulator [Acidiphilium sp. 21-68-69]HQT60764.1 Cu(I)-responsive transcriptional regulator [Acidiphilium sp.]HQU10682.1 Cu(I)-responsive transcriptional regulator [Acidiphilium sp.]
MTGREMTIGEAAALSGVSAKMIRHYERIGLIGPPLRGETNNYRFYDDALVNELGFIHRARDLGFAIADIRALLSLWRDRNRPSREVRAIAVAHITALEAKVAALQAMSAQLRHLVNSCEGSDRPDCPILDELASPGY